MPDNIEHYGVKGMRWGVSKGKKVDALGRARRGASKKTRANINRDSAQRARLAAKLPTPFNTKAASINRSITRGEHAVNNFLSKGNRRTAINVAAGAATIALILSSK